MKLNKCVQLDKSRETELLKEYGITKSSKIRDRLFEAYYPLVKKIAYSIYKRSPKSKVTLVDLMGDGSVGLLIAIDKYNPEKSDHLYPVAYLWIKEYVHRGVMKNLSMVRDLSTNSKTRLLYHKFRRTVAELGYDRPLTDFQRDKLSEHLKVPLIDIEFFENVMDDNVDFDALSEIIGTQSFDTFDMSEVSLDTTKILDFVKGTIAPKLSVKDRYILEHRILSEGNVEEIAMHFNQSKAAIYQAEKRIREEIVSRFRESYQI